MKKTFLIFLTLASLSVKAQKNTLLDLGFWRDSPDVATVQAEVAKGNNPAESNAMAFDAVTYAINAKAPNATIIYLLEQKGNDVNKPTHDARTYLFLAASKGNIELMDYLISKGAKVNMEDSHGTTPLSFAATTGQTDAKVYDVLIKNGANIKQLNRDGANLLLLGIANDKDLTLTNYFVSKGLSLQSVDANGNTAFNYVARTGNIELMKKLVEKGVKYNDIAFLMAAQGGRGISNTIEVYQYLESLKLKPTVTSKTGENVLYFTARKPNQEEIIKYFISKGVDANQPDADGTTPFMVAASANRDTATIALLLSGVKNINQTNKKGVSALAMAVKSNSGEVVQFLINKGANVNTVDTDGNNLAYYLLQSFNPQAGGGFGGQGQGAPGGQQGAQARPAGGAGNGQGTGAPEQRQGGGNRQGGARGDAFGAKMKVLQDNGFNIATPQKDGNTLYHLAVIKNDLGLLKRLEKLNIDVNAKNKEGLTPLHKAAMVSKDDTILKYLLSIGAKKEITTEFKETAFDLSKENEYLSKNKISTDFLK